MRALFVLACTALTAMVVGAPPAQASLIRLTDDVYTYTATAFEGADDNTITIVSAIAIVGASIGSFTFTDTSTISSWPEGCSSPSDTEVICRADGITRIVVNAGEGDDAVSMASRGGAMSVPLTLNGQAGDDTLAGFLSDDDVDGGEGDDTVLGGPGNDRIDGGPGTDRIRYDETNRLAGVNVDLSTTAGSDGSPGELEDAIRFEQVVGTRFADALAGDGQPNRLDGGLSADRLSGVAGNDILNGGDGDDEIAGGTGADQLRGQGGSDLLDGGPDADLLDGGAGADAVDYAARREDLKVTIGAGGDDDGGLEDGPPGARDDVLAAEVLLGGSGRDALSTAEPAPTTLRGNGGDDVLIGGALGDLLVGGSGADTIVGRDGQDTASYGDPGRTEGVTVTIASGASDDGSSFDTGAGGARDAVLAVEAVEGSALNDTLIGDGAANDLSGAGGDDVLVGAGGNDALRGGDGADTVSYADRTAGRPVTVVLGGTGGNGEEHEDDVVGADVESVAGGDDADTILGDDGPNVLAGGSGDDVLAGLGGVDAFVAGDGADRVRAVDGLAESVDCGGGLDQVEVDAVDMLAGCEGSPPPARRDSDGDTFVDEQDCAPLNARIFPGAIEVAGNQIDENCDGFRADFPVLNVLVSIFANFDPKRGALIKSLLVRAIAPGARVTISCRPPRGKRCPFTRPIRRTFPRGRARVDFKSSFKRRRLPMGTALEIRVTKPDAIGRVRIDTIRATGFRSRTRCVRPGAAKTIRCPT